MTLPDVGAQAARLTRVGLRIALVSLAALAVVYYLAIWRTPEEASQAIAEGRICDAKTLLAVYAWQRYLTTGTWGV